MSFGFISDVLIETVQLPRRTVEVILEVLGEHDDLTVGVSCLLNALCFFESEILWTRFPGVGLLESEIAWRSVVFALRCRIQLRLLQLISNRRDIKGVLGDSLWKLDLLDLWENERKLQDLVCDGSVLLGTYILEKTSLDPLPTCQDDEFQGLGNLIYMVLGGMVETAAVSAVFMLYSPDGSEFSRPIYKELIEQGFPSSEIERRKELVLASIKALQSKRNKSVHLDALPLAAYLRKLSKAHTKTSPNEERLLEEYLDVPPTLDSLNISSGCVITHHTDFKFATVIKKLVRRLIRPSLKDGYRRLEWTCVSH